MADLAAPIYKAAVTGARNTYLWRAIPARSRITFALSQLSKPLANPEHR